LPLYPPFASDFADFTHVSTSWDTEVFYSLFREALLSSQEIAQQFNTTLTLFIPTAGAFENFSRLTQQRFLEPIWKRHSLEFLLNHIGKGAQTRTELLAQAPDGTIDMLNGQTYSLRRSGARPRIRVSNNNQARVEFGDIIALDGYVHMIDQVLSPVAVSQTIYDRKLFDPDFSLFIENIDLVDLTNILQTDSPLTVFAPDNQAFRRVRFGANEGGDIIKRHVTKGLFYRDVLANMTQLSTVDSEVLGVELRGPFNEHLYVGNALVYEADIFANNGLVHHVDRVIGVPYDTLPPTTSPAPTVTAKPSAASDVPSVGPTTSASPTFTAKPTGNPSSAPSSKPTVTPMPTTSHAPSQKPSISVAPSSSPSNTPSSSPSTGPTRRPRFTPNPTAFFVGSPPTGNPPSSSASGRTTRLVAVYCGLPLLFAWAAEVMI